MPGSWLHLADRFFRAWKVAPLTTDETELVRGLLHPGEASLFFAQPVLDQRHGLETALAVGEGDPDLIRAALLHDVGKRHAHLGIWGRSLASIGMKLGMRGGRRSRVYRRHGHLGALELRRLGCSPLVEDFTAHHHGARPDHIGTLRWQVLKAADERHIPRGRPH